MKPKCDGDNGNHTKECCAFGALQACEDFNADTKRLTEIIHAAGHRVLYLPKYHCELNPIERYWAGMKKYIKARTDHTAATLRTLVEEALVNNVVPVESVRRFFNLAWRWCRAYEKNLSYIESEKEVMAHRKQRIVHRGINERMDEIVEQSVPLKDALQGIGRVLEAEK